MADNDRWEVQQTTELGPVTMSLLQRQALVIRHRLKSAISKWLPVVGAAAMAVWSNYLTRQVGKKAIEIFEKEIVLSEEVVEELPMETESLSVPAANMSRHSAATLAAVRTTL